MKLFYFASFAPHSQILSSALVLSLPPSLENATSRISLRDATAFGVASTVREYPFASFHKLEATSYAPTADPDRLTEVRLFFKGNNAHPVIVVDMATWGHWRAPRTIDSWPLAETVLPYRLRLDVRDADAKMKQAGYTGPYHALDVQAFSHQGHLTQPWWIFLMEGHIPSFVWVGDWDGSVMPDWHLMKFLKAGMAA